MGNDGGVEGELEMNQNPKVCLRHECPAFVSV